MFKHMHILSQYQWLDRQIKQIKNGTGRDQQDKGQ